ncbi:zinc finger family protein [Trifolium pratense]|uniref:RING-type E3 ubiquitin transferase n=1 Tax=Trifolium pratense TaxID=57577 RepID=A0A2K3N763_TRIPR|nr:zinc finger family protein [Trifolium pratense]
MMDENPKKKGTDGMVAPKKRMSVVFRDTANTRNRNDQICSRVGCSSTANPPKVAQVRPSEKGKSSRPSMQSTSSGKEVIGSSRRTATNPAKPLVKPRRTLTSSGLQADKEGKESTNVTLTEVRKSSGVSNLSSQRNFNQRPGTGFSQRENESIRPAKQAVSSSKYGLRNLRCNTISDIIPSSCSSSDSTLNRKKAMVKKINTGGESSSTVKGKKMTGSSLEGLNSGSRNGISISEARGSKNIPPRRDNSRTTVRPERSISRYARGGLSSQGNENLTETNEPRVQLPSSPHRIDLNSPVIEVLSDIMPISPEEYDTPHSLINQNGFRRYDMDNISEVLLALERIEQNEELTHEQIRLLETNSIVSGLDLYDRHRDMRLDIDDMSYEELLALEERMGTVSTALTEEALSDSLKRSTYQSAPSDDASNCVNEDKGDIKCCICQDEYVVGDEVGRLQCSHKYHVDCIQDWLRLKNWCPICKGSAALSNSSPSH